MDTTRDQMPAKAVWGLESFYATPTQWERNFNELMDKAKEGWSHILTFKGKITGDPQVLKKLIDSYFAYSRDLEKVYTYAHLRHDENVADDLHKTNYQKAVALLHEFSNAASWIESEILQLDDKTLDALASAKELQEYKFFLRRIRDQKAHVLSADKEELLALAGQSLETARSTFSAFNNADLVFGNAVDSLGKEHKVTHGAYHSLMKSPDRVLRESGFKSIHKEYGRFQNTIAQLISGHVQNHVFTKRARGYNSCVEAALKNHNIPVAVYKELINTARKHLDANHEYIALRKKIMGVDELHYWDVMTPLVKEMKLEFPYEEAASIVVNSVAPLGSDYQAMLRKGIMEDRWVDVYENKGKRSGAYSSGCYDSMPYILMNYHGTLNDVLTLSHEAGHSMNSLLSNRKQRYHEAQYSIFVAEVASTFNEQLTYEYLLERAKTREERLYILNQQIDSMRSTFFRQVMFAEFELKIHELAENNVPITPAVLKEIYLQLNTDYFGPNLVLDEELSYECLRIPHFYYNFYVYQYATGIAAATTLVKKVKEEGNGRYLEFLAAGGSDYPIPILQKAGVDMASSEAVETFIETFRGLVRTFEKEFVQKDK